MCRGVALKKEQVSFPVGKVNRLQLYPMSFKEFVIANDRMDLIEVFDKWPTEREIPTIYKEPMEELLKAYYIVGGMPEVVKTWIETHDYDEVEEVQNEILGDYADDFSKQHRFRMCQRFDGYGILCRYNWQRRIISLSFLM